MRDVSERLRDVLASGVFDVAWTADLIYDGVPRAQNLLVSDPRFSWDAGAQIQGTGSCQIGWDDVFSQSIVPREIGDLFSPFGAELQADVIVSAGSFTERVSMGRFVLDSVPEGVEYAVEHPRPPQTPVYTEWVEQARNLFPNPSFESTVAIPVGADRSTEWAASGTLSLHVPPATGYGYGPYGSGPYGSGPA